MSSSADRRASRLARLAGVYAIVGDEEPIARAEQALAGGAAVVQLRMKRAPAGQVLDVARRIVALAQGRGLVIVNDRADLALLSGADGVHLGADDLPIADARRLVGPELLVGGTARTLEAARGLLAEGADHVGFGPVFPSATKPIDVVPRGLSMLTEVCRGLGAPVVAISGIDDRNIGDVARAGAACAAVIGALGPTGEVAARTARLVRAFAEGRA